MEENTLETGNTSRTTPTPVFEIKKKPIGAGGESVVFQGKEQITNEDGSITTGPKSVVKVPLLAVLWQNREGIHELCKEAFESTEIPHLPVELHKKAILVDGHSGEKRTHSDIQVSEFIDKITDLTVDYAMLTDPLIGQDTINQITNIIVQSNEMAKEKGLGPDPFGIEAMVKTINAIQPAIMLQIIELLPNPIRRRVKPFIRTNVIKVNNLVRHQSENETEPVLKLIDIGALDLNDPKIGSLITFLYELGFAGLTEMVLCANRDLAKKQDCEPNKEVIDKLTKLKEEKNNAILYQIFAELMMKILQPYMDKSVIEKDFIKEFDTLPVKRKILIQFLRVILGN